MIPYIVEAEILIVEKKAIIGESNKIRYTCQAKMPSEDGSSLLLLPGVEAPTAFGGIADYFNMRHRASFDSSDYSSIAIEQNERDAAVGDRCLIAFINGSIMNPKIICFLQHPNQTPEITGANDKEPQAVLQLLGMRVEIDEEGQMRLIHKGAPKVVFDAQDSTLLDSDLLGIKQELTAKTGGSDVGGNNNPQVEPAEDSEVTMIEMLAGGLFRVRDQEGQAIEFDRENGTMFFSNSYLPSTLSPDAPQAARITGEDNEYILFDKNEGMLEFQGSKLLSLIALKDRSESTGGDHENETKGSYDLTIGKNETRKVTGESSLDIQRSWKVNVNESTDILSKGGISIKDGAKGGFVSKNGKVAIGGASAELLDLVSKLMEQISKLDQALQVHLHTGNLGFPVSPPTNVADFVLNQTEVEKLKVQLGTIKGSL